jgi:hypothetical protein
VAGSQVPLAAGTSRHSCGVTGRSGHTITQPLRLGGAFRRSGGS